ncbi:MAG: hypothetical protein J6Y37_18785 [Paludibacteraceae bacterium]|nr:hypothetical protein [Paludibacteraceae bacterium]
MLELNDLFEIVNAIDNVVLDVQSRCDDDVRDKIKLRLSLTRDELYRMDRELYERTNNTTLPPNEDVDEIKANIIGYEVIATSP